MGKKNKLVKCSSKTKVYPSFKESKIEKEHKLIKKKSVFQQTSQIWAMAKSRNLSSMVVTSWHPPRGGAVGRKMGKWHKHWPDLQGHQESEWSVHCWPHSAVCFLYEQVPRPQKFCLLILILFISVQSCLYWRSHTAQRAQKSTFLLLSSTPIWLVSSFTLKNVLIWMINYIVVPDLVWALQRRE